MTLSQLACDDVKESHSHSHVTPSQNNKARSKVQVIDRAAHLLSALSAEDEPVSLTHLSETTDLHAATTHRILASLCVHGLVERSGERRYYRIGKKIAQDASVKDRLEVTQRKIARAARDPLRAISESTSGTSQLLYRDNNDLLVRLAFSNGVPIPDANARCALHRNPVGRIWLGHLGAVFVRHYVQSQQSSQVNDQQLNFTRLWDQVSGTVSRGFAFERSNADQGVVTLGLLVRDRISNPVAAITLTGRQTNIDSNMLDALHDVASLICETTFQSTHSDSE